MRKSGTGTMEHESAVKEFGLYTAATVEYSSLVMLGVMERGSRIIAGSVAKIANPLKKIVPVAKKIIPVAKTVSRPFSWSAEHLAAASRRGMPVHLDYDSLEPLKEGLASIEKRLARIEKRGIAVAGGVMPVQVKKREPVSKEKSIMLRSVLESTKALKDE